MLSALHVSTRRQASSNRESKILLVNPIIHSHTPPRCDEWCGLRMHTEPFWSRYCFILSLILTPKSSKEPIKLVPLSERYNFPLPRMLVNRLHALIKEELLNSSITSMCTAREVKQVKSTAQRLLVTCPPGVHRAPTDQGPIQSNRGKWWSRH